MSLSQSTVRTLEPGPEDWLEEFGDMLFSFAKRRVNNSAAAEDLVQETLIAGINGLDSFSGKSNIGTWLKGILRNKIFDYYRQQRRDRMSSGVATEETAERREFDFLGTWRRDPGLWNDSPEAALDSREFMLQMQKCISSLPQRLRDIFMMHTFDKVTPEQITETLGVSENNLWVSLYRSRMSLRECLDKNWFKQKGDC